VEAHTVLMLTASHLDIFQPDLLRMARSVRPDPGTVAAPVRLGWLPAGWRTTNVTISGPSAAAWRGEVAAANPAGRSLRYLVVDLGGGRLLTLTGDGGGISLEDLTRIAEQVDITPTGLDWLGG
jgi:hypothetical protein